MLRQGTWKMREDVREDNEKVAALRLDIEPSMTPIDTAEIHGGQAGHDNHKT